MLSVIPDRLRGLCFSPVPRKCWKGLSLYLSLGPRQEPLRFAPQLTRTRSPGTSTHWHILSSPSSRSLSWHLEFILPPKMRSEHPDYVWREVSARFLLLPLLKDTSQNPDFNQAKALKKLAWRRQILPVKCSLCWNLKNSITCCVLVFSTFL